MGAAAEAPEDDPPQDGEEPAEGEEGSAEPAEGDEELLAEAVDGDGEAVEADGEAEPEEPGPEGDAAAASEQPGAEGEEGAEGASPAPEENASEDPRGGESPVPQEWGEPGAEDEEEGVHAEASERSAVGESPGDEEAAGDRPLSGGHRPSTSTVGSQDPGRPASGGAATRAHFAEEPEPPKVGFDVEADIPCSHSVPCACRLDFQRSAVHACADSSPPNFAPLPPLPTASEPRP